MIKTLMSVSLVALLATLLAAPASAAEPMTSAKLVVDGKAKDSGAVKLAFTPQGGEKKEISVTIQSKMSKGDIARDLAKELTVALGKSYKVDRYDPDKIKISAEKNVAPFTIEIEGVTVPGVTVMMK